MFQYNVPHVAWPCCYPILVTLLPCCHASRHGKFMFHCYVALLPFTNNLVRNKQNMRMFHMYVSGKMTWWDKWCTCLWDELQLVEAKHRGCYSCHHLSPMPQPESTRQTKVASSLDTTSTLLTTTLASIRVIRLYREPSTRVSSTGTDDEPTNK